MTELIITSKQNVDIINVEINIPAPILRMAKTIVYDYDTQKIIKVV